MLKVNVGVSRKLSKDYNSTGFTLNLEGEICAKLDDPEAVIGRIREYYDLAEEALSDQIHRHEEVTSAAVREADPPKATRSNYNGTSRQGGTNGNGHSNGDGPTNGHSLPTIEPVTRKQIEYIHDIAGRKELSPKQLDDRVATVVGRQTSLDRLSKQEAGQVIEALLGSRVKVR